MWHRWFAWYPVAFGPHIVWLKTIQRKRYHSFDNTSWWVYRRDIFPL